LKKEDYNANILFHKSNAMNRTRIFFRMLFREFPVGVREQAGKRFIPCKQFR